MSSKTCSHLLKNLLMSVSPQIYPFDRLLSTLPLPANLLPFDTTTSPTSPVVTAQLHLTIQAFHKELESALRKRVLAVPHVPPPPQARIAVLFSGGLDCTTLALMLDRVLPAAESIDLINVAFENPRVMEGKARGAAAKGKGEKKKGYKGKPGKGKGKERVPEDQRMDVDGAVQAEGEDIAMEQAEDTTTAENTDAEPETEMEGYSKEPSPSLPAPAPPIAGLDPLPWPDASSQPSIPAHSFLTEVDPAAYEVPDRLTGRKSWQELQTLRPARVWNFVGERLLVICRALELPADAHLLTEVNVPYQEMLEHRPKVIQLMR